MGRGRDKFWEYVEESDGHLLCKFCKRRFSRAGITRFKSHLSGIRGRDIEICPKVTPDVQQAAIQAIGATMNETESSNFLNNAGETDQVISTSDSGKKAKRLHQPTHLGKGTIDKSVVDKMLAKFIISNNISFDEQTPYLIDLLKSMAEFGPSTYEFPNSLVLGIQSMPEVYKETEEHIRNAKELSTTTGCSLMMSNLVKDSKLECINVFADTPVGLLYLDKIVVPKKGMTFNYFMDGIFRMIETWGPKNVFQCIFNLADEELVNSITDFIEDNFFKAVQDMISSNYPWIYLNRCVSHEVGLILIVIYLRVPLIHKTTQLAKVIFQYLYKHEISLIPRKEQGNNQKYCYPGLSRIGVEFFMLNSILEVEKELKALQPPIASESCEGPSHVDNVAKIVNKAIHSSEFWSRGKKVVRVLQSLFQVLDLIHGNGPTAGYLYAAMKRAEEVIEQHCDAADQIHYETIGKLFKMFRDRVHPIYAAASFLNPAYFCSENFTEDSEMQLGLQLVLMPDDEQESFSKQLQLYRSKVSDLFSAMAMTMLNKFHPRKWWECFGDHCPILQKHAIWILSQTCATPTLCHLCEFQPNDFIDELRMNLIVTEKFSMLKSQNWEPIDLDKISGLPEYAHYTVREYLEDVDQSNGSDYADLLVISNPNDRILSALGLNARDDSLEFSDQSDWLFYLEELGNLDDFIGYD